MYNILFVSDDASLDLYEFKFCDFNYITYRELDKKNISDFSCVFYTISASSQIDLAFTNGNIPTVFFITDNSVSYSELAKINSNLILFEHPSASSISNCLSIIFDIKFQTIIPLLHDNSIHFIVNKKEIVYANEKFNSVFGDIANTKNCLSKIFPLLQKNAENSLNHFDRILNSTFHNNKHKEELLFFSIEKKILIGQVQVSIYGCINPFYVISIPVLIGNNQYENDLNNHNFLESLNVRNEAENYKKALNSHTFFAVSNLNGEINYANGKYCELFNIEKDKIKSSKSNIFENDLYKPVFFNKLKQQLLIGKTWNGELCIATKANKKKWYKSTYLPLKNIEGRVNQIILICTDITLQKHAERQIRISEERLNAFIQSAPQGFIQTDKNLKISLANSSVRDILNVLPNQIIGLSLIEIVKSIFPLQKYEELSEIISKGQSVNFEQELNLKSKKVILKINAFKAGDGVGIIFSDITERIKRENELIKAKEQAETASKERSQFLSVMSHEIRTPLNAVIGLSNILHDEAKDSSQKQNLDTLKFSADKLLSLVNDILNFSKIDQKKVILEEKSFSLFDFITETRNSFKFTADQKNISFEVLIDNRLKDFNIIGDPTRLNQIITNLLSNALKFTNEGKVELIVELTKQTQGKAQIYFQIIDTGIGIPEDKQKSIFDLFSQAESNITRKYGGTGLGLSITKKLVELHKSKILLESKKGVGSNFSFLIKYKIDQEETEKNIVVENFSLDFLQKNKILLVEDNDFNVLVVSQFLNKWKLEFERAYNGKQAVEMNYKFDYDLILMDLQMPVMDGYTASKEIRVLDTETPIIALTAESIDEIKDNVLEAGMNDCIAKPFNPDTLKSKLIQFLKKEK